MTNTTDPYGIPASELAPEKEDKAATFGTLNFWRKFYLVLMWLSTAAMSGAILYVAFSPESAGVSIFSLTLVVLMVGMSLWTHIAIVKRSIGNLTAIAIINVIPFFNIIGALIMLSILRVTKKERTKYNVIKA